MFRIYGRQGSGSAAVEALLALAGVPHEVIDVQKQPDGSAPSWFLQINPRGEVPCLRLPDDTVMTESAAIMIHVADSLPAAGLAPALGTAARAKYLRWMIYMATNGYDADLRMYYPDRYSTVAGAAEGIKQKAIIDLNFSFEVFSTELGKGPFILGEQMSAADVYAAMIISWSDDFAGLVARHPNLQRLYAGVSANPAVRSVWDRHGMP